MVQPGAQINTGQSVMELETDKAVVEVPSSVSGTVQEIRVKEGDKIKVGQVIFTVDGADGNSGPAASSQPAAAAPAPAPKEAPPAPPAPKEAPKVATAAAASVATSPALGATEFKLPELGENISEGDLVRLMISP